MHYRTLLSAAAAAAIFASATATAQGYRWLDTSPVRFFTDEDWEMLRATAREALDNGADGTEVSWKNADTDVSGTIMVMNTYEENGLRCRKTKFLNHARGLTGGGIYRLCKVADGKWKISN